MTTVKLSQDSYPVMLGFECGLSLILLHAFKNAHEICIWISKIIKILNQ
jgi:hypothetical protein